MAYPYTVNTANDTQPVKCLKKNFEGVNPYPDGELQCMCDEPRNEMDEPTVQYVKEYWRGIQQQKELEEQKAREEAEAKAAEEEAARIAAEKAEQDKKAKADAEAALKKAKEIAAKEIAEAEAEYQQHMQQQDADHKAA